MPAGAPFVLITQALVRVDMAPGEIGLAFNWRFGPANKDLGHSSYVQAQHAYHGVGLRPLSPVHVRARRSEGGDLHLTWIRRTRKGGDSWEASEVPLAEDEERYEVEILNGETVKRTIFTTAPSATYSAAEQADDFGGLPETVALRIFQISSVWGRGAPCLATV